MISTRVQQPDITLVLDREGIIREARLSADVPQGGADGWIGRPWAETVADVGADKVRRLVEDARENGASGFRQVNQRFPSGLELPIEYTAVSLGNGGGLIAVGKSLEAVAELQARLVAAQHAMERDYWKVREAEARYRLLFDASKEAVLLVRAANFHIIEANPAAISALGSRSEGQDLLREVAPEDRSAVVAMLNRVREQGKAPSLLIHLGRHRQPWLLRASVMTASPGSVFLLQLSPAGLPPAEANPNEGGSLAELIDRLPDGFVVMDRDGVIIRANRAFLDLVQVGAEGIVVGQRLGRWLGRPGADLKVMIVNIREHGFVRLFSTSIHGELGTDVEVEISAAGVSEAGFAEIGVVIRAVGHRLPTSVAGDGLGSMLNALTQEVGKSPLSQLVRETVGVVERHYIEAALQLTRGNRTLTAELLGLSRQS
ncbi:MAG: transcriptional regulator PpsR, partial [Rhodospirillales bacterium]|nr:transcriptional regulator PpsR [Rhodospirillales bacterium]